ncbi:MAG TPA: ThiF family adenylyltransferase [Armatimonadota bacterium]|jgi:adenylyltransferase/sulfurtransferase
MSTADHAEPVADDLLDVDLAGEADERYARFRLIHWWDQERLHNARVLVVGAGALGNEIIKQLGLLGVGHVLIADMDTIERSNLTRAVLFRESNIGQAKAEVAARAVEELNPEVTAQAFVGNTVYDLGAGVYSEMDLVFGALDNREARVSINQHCWNLGVPWIDGAIEVMQGVARMFIPPDGPCYECTMTELDYKLLNMRRSCALLTRADIASGKVPTTPTTASIIAGIQVQEGIKYLHRDRGLPLLDGKGFVFNGLNHDSYVVEYQRREDCLAHYTYPAVLPTEFGSATPLGEVLDFVKHEVGPNAVLELSREVCVALRCKHCEELQPLFRSLGQVTEAEGRCPRCSDLREPELMHSLYGDESYLDKTLGQVGIPPYDVFTGRDGLDMKHYLMSGDRALVMGKLA